MLHNAFYRRLFLAVVLVGLGLVPIAIAQPPAEPGPPAHAGPPQDVVDFLLSRGFQQIQPSIFERPVEGSATGWETVVYGIDGHEWLLAQQQGFLQFLEDRYELYPAPELLEAIYAQQARIAETQAMLEEMRALESVGGASTLKTSDGLTAIRASDGGVVALVDALKDCTTTMTRQADAGPGTSGPWASGASSFVDNCSNLGNVSATATAQGKDGVGNINTYTQDCPTQSGSNVSCSVYAEVEAVTECNSNGQGQVSVTVGGFLTYSVNENNSVCRPLIVTLTGPISVFVPRYSSVFARWDAMGSQGAPNYSYQWFYNNATVKSGTTSGASSYTRTYVHPGYGFSRYDTVKVTYTDSAGQVVTKSRKVLVTYESTCSDPCLCQTSPSTDSTMSFQIPEPCLIEEPTL